MEEFVQKYFIAIALVFLLIVLFLTYLWYKLWKKKNAAREEKMKRLAASIAKTKIIDTSHTATATSKAKTGSSVGRAVIGGAIAGPAGAMIGAGTAKRKVTVDEHHTTTFMVFYQDGTRNHDTVENGTELYHIYMEKLDIE